MVNRTSITKLMLVAQLSLLAALGTPVSSKQQAAEARRLQFDIPEIPDVGDFFGDDARTPCEYLELFFATQIIGEALSCECSDESSESAVSLVCAGGELCDAVDAVVEDLCHSDTFTATIPRDLLLDNSTVARVITIESCADYSIVGGVDLPDFLDPVTTQTFCLFYDAMFDPSAFQDGGLSLEDFGTCGIEAISAITGEKRRICECEACESEENGNILDFLDFGIGFDCSDSFLDGIIFNHLEQCATISAISPFALPPIVQNVTASSVTKPPTNNTQPPTTSPSATMKPIDDETPPTNTTSGVAKQGFHSVVYSLGLLTGVWLFVPYV